MLEQVLDLDRHVIGDIGKLIMQHAHDGDRVCWSVEEIGVAERNVLSSGRNLLADVREDDVALHNPEFPLVNRHDRAMPAQVLAAARSFGGSSNLARGAGDQASITTENRQGRSIGRLKRESVKNDFRGGPACYDFDQRLLELTPNHMSHADAFEHLLIRGSVKPVAANPGTGIRLPNALNLGDCEPCRRVHGQMEGDPVRVADAFSSKRFARKIGGRDVVASRSQPGGG